MGCVTKTLGRILFVTILVSQAYLHLNKPDNYAADFNTNWTHLTECVAKYAPGVLPAASSVSMQTIFRLTGVYGSKFWDFLKVLSHF